MRRTVLVLCLTLASCGEDAAPPAPAPVASATIEYADYRAALSTGNLFVPGGYVPKTSSVDLIVHFHGADWASEQAHALGGKAAALVTVVYNGLSSAYSTPFQQDPTLLGKILDEAVVATGAARDVTKPVLGKVVISSFSAGYGAVREILLSGAYDNVITDIVLADSLHAGYSNGAPNPAQMQPFADFALAAAAGQKRMVLSHSAIVPGSYASTTETADYLIGKVGTSRFAVDLWIEGDMHQTSEAKSGLFLVRGFTGTAAEDHMDHLHHMGHLWKLISLPSL